MPISAPSARSKKSRSVHTNGARSTTPASAETSSDNTQFLADPFAILRASGTQRAALVAQLQRRTGNAHVTRMIRRLRAKRGTDAVVQRLESCVEPAPAPTMMPETDPAFQKVEAKTHAVAKNQKAHPPAKQEAGKAQAASVPPGNEVKSKAAAAQVGEMNQQKPGSFDKKAFIDSVEKAVEAITPKSEDDASDFKGSGKAGQVASQVGGMVSSNKQAAEKDIKHTTAAAPDPAKAGPQQKVIPLAPEVAKPRGVVNAAEGMPKPRPADQVSLAHTKCETDNQLEEADVTEDQLKNANEPQFDKAVEAKQEADAHAEEAPKQVRQEEKQALQATNVGANAAAGAGMTGMQASGLKALKAVGSRKVSTKDKDETLRAEIAQKLEAVYGRTKDDVTKILDDLGPRVEAMFTSRERAARATFENYVDREMDAYKDRRYSGWGGKLRHLGDYTGITSLPDEVNVFYQTGRRNYLAAMRQVIGDVADVVGKELGRAKARIAQGRKEIDAEVSKLPKNQQKLGREAADNIQSRFDDLNSDVDSKQNELVQSIAKQYSEGIKAVDDKIAAMKEANKGLLQKAKDAIKGVIETIGKLKDMLFNVLAKAASVIGQIIRHPIDFLGNLVGAVKQGFNQFVDNIGTHLKNGLMGWLFGTLAEGGIQMPESFDLKGILSLVLQLLGLTYANIRARAVAIVGEKTVALLEKAVDVFKVLVAEGAAGLWKFISGKLGEMKDAVLDEIKGFVITKVITAGITWLLSMLNPASAFIKACKMIYDVVMFFVERGSQIMSLVNAILDGVIQIAGGSIGAAASMVENALGKAIPLAISFLASLLGVGGIAGKVKSVIEKIKAPVNKLVDGVVMGAAKGFKKLGGDKLIGLAQKGVGWAKQKVKQGVQWAKAKATAAKQWAAGKVKGATAWASGKWNALKQGREQKKEQRAASDKVKAEALRELAAGAIGLGSIERFTALRRQILAKFSPHGLTSLTATLSGGDSPNVKLRATASPAAKTVVTWKEVFATEAATGEPEALKALDELEVKFDGKDPKMTPADRQAVFAVLSVDGRPFGQMEKNVVGGKHAEEFILDKHWDAAVATAKQAAEPNGDRVVPVVLSLSASPCSRCSSILSMKLRETRAALGPAYNQRISFSVASKGAYEKSTRIKGKEREADFANELRSLKDGLLKSKVKVRNFVQKRLMAGAPLKEFLNTTAEDNRLKTKIVIAGKSAEYRGAEHPLPTATTDQDLMKLMAAGWQVQVIAVKDAVSDSGLILKQAIERVRAKFLAANSGNAA